jgi:hypothetical protein
MSKHLHAMKNKYNRVCKRHEELLETLTVAEDKLVIARQFAEGADEDLRFLKYSQGKWHGNEVEDAEMEAAETTAAWTAALVAVVDAEAELVRVYFKMYNLLEDPLFAPALKYDPRSRIFISDSLQALYQDLESLQQTSYEMKDNLRTRCAEVQAYITTIPFVREIVKPPTLKRKWMMLSPSERAIALRAGISDME